MSAQHTEGPWQPAERTALGQAIRSAAGTELAIVLDAPDFPAERNASVFAASEQMLALLQSILRDAQCAALSGRTEAEGVAAYWPKRRAQVIAAIAKATGAAS